MKKINKRDFARKNASWLTKEQFRIVFVMEFGDAAFSGHSPDVYWQYVKDGRI